MSNWQDYRTPINLGKQGNSFKFPKGTPMGQLDGKVLGWLQTKYTVNQQYPDSIEFGRMIEESKGNGGGDRGDYQRDQQPRGRGQQQAPAQQPTSQPRYTLEQLADLFNACFQLALNDASSQEEKDDRTHIRTIATTLFIAAKQEGLRAPAQQ